MTYFKVNYKNKETSYHNHRKGSDFKDINGNYIYDGDIVIWNGNKYSRKVVEYEEDLDLFTIEYMLRAPMALEHLVMFNSVEVVGNIFESPDVVDIYREKDAEELISRYNLDHDYRFAGLGLDSFI